jgi:hypothetical protein
MGGYFEEIEDAARTAAEAAHAEHEKRTGQQGSPNWPD